MYLRAGADMLPHNEIEVEVEVEVEAGVVECGGNAKRQ
jgi:hypothetical protein